nr:bifunctional UDP-sugar hydrolase/5'-nucleotidase [uncultured Fretibacterium sp.]
MMKRLLRAGLICGILLAFVSPAAGRDGRVTILSINHLKSQLLPISDKVNKTSVRMGGLAHAAGLVKQERSQDDPNAIFVQTGEAVEGPMWRYFGGVPEFSSLSAAGIQVGMIGKREFDYGWDHLKQALDHVVFPMVLSNVSISDPEAARKFARNVVVPAGDLKVGFFAMLSTWLFSVTRKTDELTVLTDTEGIAREMVADLRAQGADVIVMLSNLSEGENRHLAESVPGIHAIVGRGVSEKEEVQLQLVQGPGDWTTALAWGGSRGKFLGKLVLTTEKGRLLWDRTSWRLLNVTPKIPPNPEVMRIAAEYESKLNGSLERAVGFFESPVDAQKRTLRVREMPLGDFMADGLRWRFKTDVGLVNGGSLRGDRIFPAGEVSEKNLTEILPFGNGIEVVTVTGAQLRQIMELSASALIVEGEHFDPAFRVPDGGFLQISGLKVVYDLREKAASFDSGGRLLSWGNRLKRILVQKDGEWREVDDGAKYTVAVNSWIAGGGDRYFVFEGARRESTEVRELDVLVDYLRSFPEGRVDMKTDGRIVIEK